MRARVLQSSVLLRKFVQALECEKRHMVEEFSQVGGLMALLMKRRNRQKWSKQDRAQLVEHLRRLPSLSPYLAVLFLPGGLALLPVLAWWLDRRRGKRAGRTVAAQ